MPVPTFVGQAVKYPSRGSKAKSSLLASLFQLKTGPNRLHPKMIFFVDHNTERLSAIHHHRAARALGGMLATDQMALDQHLFVQCCQVLQAFGKRVLHLRKLFDARPDLFEDRCSFGFLRPSRKGTVTQIPRKADPATDHNLVMRAFTAQPFPCSRKHACKFHAGFEGSVSSCLI